MEQITLAMEEETIRSLETFADRDYAGDTDAAAVALLDEWLTKQEPR